LNRAGPPTLIASTLPLGYQGGWK